MQVINSLPSGSYAAVLTNDIFAGEAKETYMNRSLETLKTKYLKKDYFYIYVKKAASKNGQLERPGHIISFVTNGEATVIEGSCVSLRTGKMSNTKTLSFTLGHLQGNKLHTWPVWEIKFVPIEEEICKHFLTHARPDPSISSQDKRFLFGIPVSRFPGGQEFLLQSAKQTKTDFHNKEYFLCDGIVKDNITGQKEVVKSQNCVSAFYKKFGVSGTITNPSPQMAAWSYLKFLLGLFERENLIDGMKFRVSEIERVEDDDLRLTDKNRQTKPN